MLYFVEYIFSILLLLVGLYDWGVCEDVTWGLAGIGSSCSPPVCCPGWCWGTGGQTRAARLCSVSWGIQPPEEYKHKNKTGIFKKQVHFLPRSQTSFSQCCCIRISGVFYLCWCVDRQSSAQRDKHLPFSKVLKFFFLSEYWVFATSFVDKGNNSVVWTNADTTYLAKHPRHRHVDL